MLSFTRVRPDPLPDMPIPTASALYDVFDQPAAATVGIEEEVMLLDPDSLDLLPRAGEVIAAATSAVAAELPASQLELNTAPARTVGAAIGQLARSRRALAVASRGIGLLAVAGVHPFANIEGQLTDGPRYAGVIEQYGSIARRQLVSALQIHVAIRPAARAVAVYNALRSYLPELAALAANSPFHGGADTGLASVRPKLAENLPRQGIPPVIANLEFLAHELAWLHNAGGLRDFGQWWWELRLHPRYGTLEIRVPDAQANLTEAAGVAAFAHSLCCWLAARHDAGELPAPAPTWRIEQNRWSACRDGLDGTLADLGSGQRIPARERISGLVEAVMPIAKEIGCAAEITALRSRIHRPAAPARYRAIAAEVGLVGLVRTLVDEFLPVDHRG